MVKASLESRHTDTTRMQTPILEVRNLNKQFKHASAVATAENSVYALRDVNLEVYEGETLGIVGESGCGKTTLGRTLVRLYTPTSGEILAEGSDIARLEGAELMDYRKMIQMVFQDPYASLNPRMKIKEILAEPLKIMGMRSKAAITRRIDELIQMVNLHDDSLDRYPHQFSGGQRQRIGIARALAINPKIIVADEPVSALDVSIQAQILNIIVELRRIQRLTLIFISHDLSVISFISHRVVVMYLGRVVEIAPTEALYERPLHPYTRMLLDAVPTVDDRANYVSIRGVSDFNQRNVDNHGCPFALRCPFVQDLCTKKLPEQRTLKNANSLGRKVACHFAEEIDEKYPFRQN